MDPSPRNSNGDGRILPARPPKGLLNCGFLRREGRVRVPMG